MKHREEPSQLCQDTSAMLEHPATPAYRILVFDEPAVAIPCPLLSWHAPFSGVTSSAIPRGICEGNFVPLWTQLHSPTSNDHSCSAQCHGQHILFYLHSKCPSGGCHLLPNPTPGPHEREMIPGLVLTILLLSCLLMLTADSLMTMWVISGK